MVFGFTYRTFLTEKIKKNAFMQCLAFQLAGASYMEVHSAGGGINFTVDHTRSASEEELETLLLPRLERMIKAGE